MWKLFLLNMYKGMKKWMMTALLLMLITTVQAGTKGNDKMSADIRQLAAQHFDMTLQTATDLYVMELKIDRPAREALEQIDQKGYLLPYSREGLHLHKVGISFSTQERTLSGWEIADAGYE